MKEFPPFDLKRLISTVFEPVEGKRICILIDLENPADIKKFGFLKDKSLTIQKHAHGKFYQGFKNGALEELGITGGEIFAYKTTGGSNLAGGWVEGNGIGNRLGQFDYCELAD